MFNFFRRKREEKERTARLAEIQAALDNSERITDLRRYHNQQAKEKEREELRKKIIPLFKKPVLSTGQTMDSCIDNSGYSGSGFNINLPSSVLDWFASYGVLSPQENAILAQHWLIDKCCRMPADDAVRGGYELACDDQNIIDELSKFNKKIGLNQSMQEYINFGRVFGIRVALFVVDSKDPKYYEYPFNIDGVEEGSYKGISQVDPQFVQPLPVDGNLTDPASRNFYDPSFYLIQGKKYHKSHLCVYIPYPVSDMFKPCYRYGGKSLPQMIYSRVYAAERTADEAPQLAMTKRTTVLQLPDSGLANPEELAEKLNEFATFRDNYGVKLNGQDEILSQFDTSLADLDNVIMTSFQLVAAEAEIPATKLLGTQPKGFNSTGNYELQNYWQVISGIQYNYLTPLLEKSNSIAMKSLGLAGDIEIIWKPLDNPTEEQRAIINKTKADTAAVYSGIGAIDGEDVRLSINEDKNSEFYGVAENDEEATFNEEANEMGEPEEGRADIQRVEFNL